MRKLMLACLLSMGALLSTSAHSADIYPPERVKIVVPYPAGGPIDFTARLLAEKMAAQWKNTVIVENRSGAASTIGTSYVARSAKDGSVILLATAGLSIQPSVYSDLPYDALKDLTPVTRLATSASVLAVNPEVPGDTLPEVLDYLRKHPGTPYGSQGVGSFSQLVMEVFQAKANIDLLHVPYRGSSPALIALMSGETKLQFDIMMPMLPAIASGKLKPIAVTSDKRQPQLPDTPTIAEAGFPDAAITSWSGFFVPGGTPKEIVDDIYKASKIVLADPEVIEKLGNVGYQVISSSPDEFSAFFKKDIQRFANAAEQARIQMKAVTK